VLDPLLVAAWIAAEILRWTSGEGCARTTLQAATKTAKELARDENIIICSQKKYQLRRRGAGAEKREEDIKECV
jgi:hypothetical protein